jgi:hypothetical protein
MLVKDSKTLAATSKWVFLISWPLNLVVILVMFALGVSPGLACCGGFAVSVVAMVICSRLDNERDKYKFIERRMRVEKETGYDLANRRNVSGVIERIGVLPGGDEASYAFRLKDDPASYRVVGRGVPVSVALTIPGDHVRFLCAGDEGEVMWKSFENITYKA